MRELPPKPGSSALANALKAAKAAVDAGTLHIQNDPSEGDPTALPSDYAANSAYAAIARRTQHASQTGAIPPSNIVNPNLHRTK